MFNFYSLLSKLPFNYNQNLNVYSILFHNSYGFTKVINFKYGTTMHEALKTYDEREWQSKYIENQYVFLYNGKKLNFYDNTPFEKLIQNRGKIEVYIRGS